MDALETGRRIRGEVIGAERSEAALDGATFDREFQELALRSCWGDVWARPGLGRRERSLVVLGMLAALGKPAELAIHVRGALTNGVAADEIKEVLLMACIYCGVPAAGEAFRAARGVLEDLQGQGALPLGTPSKASL